MSIPNHAWDAIQPPVYRQAAKPVRRVTATPRPHGVVRYQCPVTGSLVLITDEPTLARLARPQARLRCVDCGETHLLTSDA